MTTRRHSFPVLLFALVAAAVLPAAASAQAKKPNILVIWGDDIGYWNVSAYNQGMMGYKTPNIDRIAKEGALFTDWYGQQSCTAGRAAFITGQSGFRTGLLKVGLPGAKEGLQARDVTLAQLLQAQGYMTAQFGKNHLGDLDEHLPTAHGFDEFMGSLYHLNAEEEFENEDYFKDPAMIKKYQTRGVIHTWAMPDGTQKIESTGPLGKKRMETIDDEITKASLDYLETRQEGGQAVLPLVELHPYAHLDAPEEGEPTARPASASIPTAWSSTTRWSGSFSTSSRNSASKTTRSLCIPPTTERSRSAGPMAARRLSATRKPRTGKGGFRVPCAIRWPGVIKPGTVNNDIFAHEDMLPTILAAAGVPDVKEQLLKGMKVGDKTFKVHLDGYNITDALAGKAPDPRKEFFYFNDDGSLVALRYSQWKLVFRSSALMASMSGRNRSRPCACPSSSTCVPIRSSWPTTTASATPAGGSTVSSCSCRRSSTSGSSWPPSRSSRRARRAAASRWTTCCSRSSRPAKPATDAAPKADLIRSTGPHPSKPGAARCL